MGYGTCNALVACQYTEEQIADIMSIFQPLFTVWFKDTFKIPNVAANYKFRKYFFQSFEKLFAGNMSDDFFKLIAEFPKIRQQDISITGYKYKKLFTDAMKHTYDSIKRKYDRVNLERTNSEDAE